MLVLQLVHFDQFLFEFGIVLGLHRLGRGLSMGLLQGLACAALGRLRCLALAVLVEHGLQALLTVLHSDRSLVLRSIPCSDYFLEPMELHQVVLALLLHELPHLPVVNLVRIRLHDDADHYFTLLLSDVEHVVDIDALLMFEEVLRHEEHAHVERDLGVAALGLSQMFEGLLVECASKEVLDGEAAEASLNHVECSMSNEEVLELRIVIDQVVIVRRWLDELLLELGAEVQVAVDEFLIGELSGQPLLSLAIEYI